MKTLKSILVGSLGVVALFCGFLALNAGPARADNQPFCDCAQGPDGDGVCTDVLGDFAACYSGCSQQGVPSPQTINGNCDYD